MNNIYSHYPSVWLICIYTQGGCEDRGNETQVTIIMNRMELKYHPVGASFNLTEKKIAQINGITRINGGQQAEEADREISNKTQNRGVTKRPNNDTPSCLISS